MQPHDLKQSLHLWGWDGETPNSSPPSVLWETPSKRRKKKQVERDQRWQSWSTRLASQTVRDTSEGKGLAGVQSTHGLSPGTVPARGGRGGGVWRVMPWMPVVIPLGDPLQSLGTCAILCLHGPLQTATAQPRFSSHRTLSGLTQFPPTIYGFSEDQVSVYYHVTLFLGRKIWGSGKAFCFSGSPSNWLSRDLFKMASWPWSSVRKRRLSLVSMPSVCGYSHSMQVFSLPTSVNRVSDSPS